MIANEAWANPVLAEQVLRPRRDGRHEVTFRLDGLRSAKQVVQIDKMIQSMPGVHHVRIDVDSRRANVAWDCLRTNIPAILGAFDRLQCNAKPLSKDVEDNINTSEHRDLLKRLLVAGMFSMQVMTYAFVIYIGVVDFVDFTTRELFRWLGFLSSIPVVFYSCRPFFRSAIEEWRTRSPGQSMLVTLATWLIFLASALNTVRGKGAVYFDSVTMFVFLLLVARYIEERAQQRNAASGDAALDGTPLLAQRRLADGSLEAIPAIALLPGDHVYVSEGSAIPADGVLEGDTVSVDESSLFGEHRAVIRRTGDRLAAGCIVVAGAAEIRVEQSGDTTSAARLGRLRSRARIVHESTTQIGRIELRRFIWRLLVVLLITASTWATINPSRVFEATISVLVVACPCAFAITGPSAFSRALGKLARQGILVNNVRAIETLARVDVAIFDKTGTLTEPHIDIARARVIRDIGIPWTVLAKALATQSSHPVALAVASATREAVNTSARGISTLPGHSVLAHIGTRSIRLGRHADDRESEDVWLSDEQGPLVQIYQEETPKPDAKDALRDLRLSGVTTIIASGDAPSRVAKIAALLGTEESYARLSLLDKAKLLERKRREGHVTLAVGDGNNDTLILASADVSVALVSGTDLAKRQADILLLSGQLQGLTVARAMADRVMRIITQGQKWSLGYNLLAIPFAAFGVVPPWLAAIGMALSSLVVIFNAARVG